ncbi:MAG: type VI secretion system baseplate subunit TssF [Alphaproteobacteria bacterium]|nr:type VI secretion system baseplate subunit TssF [Alphaproteobacteria bacterium]
MNKNLLKYYQEEISFLREEGKKFASEYPEIAQKIDISNSVTSADPHTERMIESFAFMIAGIRNKIECNTNNISCYISDALYPGLNNVFPSCSIIQFKNNNNTNTVDVIKFKKGTKLRVNVDSEPDYLINTVYSINIYPMQIDKVYVDNKSQLNIEILTLSGPIENIKIDSLLFHINSKVLDKALEVYNLLFYKRTNVYVSVNNVLHSIPNDYIKLCGFDENETIVPIPKFFNYSFQMIKDLLLYPQKFLFFKILNLNKIFVNNNITNIYNFTIIFQIDKKISVENDSILLNSVPASNLFPCTTEAFRMDGIKDFYELVPSHQYKNNLEIHSIQSLHLINKDTGEDMEIPKYFNVCESNITEQNYLYWLQTYNSNNQYNGTYVSVIDTNVNPNRKYMDIVYAKALCINKLSAKYISLSSNIDLFQSVDNTITNTGIINIAHFISEPSESIHNSINNNDNWKLLQYLAFNKISKSNYINIKTYLQNIIKLYNSPYAKAFLQVIDNISKVEIKTYLTRKVINNHHCFIKNNKLILHYNISSTNNYYLIFFKVIEKYLQNITHFNETFNIEIVNYNKR